jgi:hypothetical protein
MLQEGLTSPAEHPAEPAETFDALISTTRTASFGDAAAQRRKPSLGGDE